MNTNLQHININIYVLYTGLNQLISINSGMGRGTRPSKSPLPQTKSSWVPGNSWVCQHSFHKSVHCDSLSAKLRLKYYCFLAVMKSRVMQDPLLLECYFYETYNSFSALLDVLHNQIQTPLTPTFFPPFGPMLCLSFTAQKMSEVRKWTVNV